ncbi:sulfurtransferase [Bacillus sp. V3-13]|uniref:sulfurtransferase n=1 Tax=Bacillus sp. V3-13 TaxID=2053728 RepID=UPI000C75C4B6|nr:sulfurtransferase [Bacillus sp. V3-13]PLR76297.1 sulfurtransferase [Bacillus sp. V3-13]
MLYVLIALFSILFLFIYRRYFPVYGVPCKDIKIEHGNKIEVILDLRDYNVAAKDPVNGALNIPIAYLNRSFQEVPRKEVHILASDKLEKNIGVRILRQKGFKVIGYALADCGCHHNK